MIDLNKLVTCKLWGQSKIVSVVRRHTTIQATIVVYCKPTISGLQQYSRIECCATFCTLSLEQLAAEIVYDQIYTIYIIL